MQVQITQGLPSFSVVGLPDKAVGESRERVRSALAAMGLALPPKRITVNLAPADLLKEGSHFDLPIALGLLAAMDVLPRDEIAGYAALGELGLDGAISPVAGVLPAAVHASARGLGLICARSAGRRGRLGGRHRGAGTGLAAGGRQSLQGRAGAEPAGAEAGLEPTFPTSTWAT